jgi:hypothetical protein
MPPRRLVASAARLTRGGMRRQLSAGEVQALLAQIRPGDDVTRIGVQITRDHLADVRALGAQRERLRTRSQRWSLPPEPS